MIILLSMGKAPTDALERLARFLRVAVPPRTHSEAARRRLLQQRIARWYERHAT